MSGVVTVEGRPAGSLRRGVQLAALVVGLVGAMTFVGGWMGDVPALRNLVPGTVEMKSWTALGLALAAGALLLLIRRDDSGRRMARAAATAVALLGTAVVSEYALGVDLGVDELLFADATGRAMGIRYPGRLAPTTAASFMLIGAALLTLDARPRRGWRVPELLVLPVAVIAALSVAGYLYAIPSLYGPASAAKMALNTAVCFLLLAAGVVVARPGGRLVRLMTTDDPGGILMRRLLPIAVLVPLLLGWAHLRSVDAGLIAHRAGTWWVTALTTLGFAVLITRVAARLSTMAAERRALYRELLRVANEDALTGLWNRRRFDEELERQVSRCRRYGETAGLLMVDLDRFKAVNDSYGHKTGDDMIRHVAATLRERLRRSDVLARLGGDEFAVLLPNATAGDAAVAADQLRLWLAERPFPCGEKMLMVSASVGAALLDRSTTSPEQALVDADVAMYAAKSAAYA